MFINNVFINTSTLKNSLVRSSTRFTRITRLICLGVLVGCITSIAVAQETPKVKSEQISIEGWSQRVEQALKEGKSDQALKEMDAAIASRPDNAQMYIMRGSLKFRSGKIADSIPDFDKSIVLEPQLKPYLWQRGIAFYYADKFKEGLEQFAIHREVNPNDVENAFWHFLCNVKLNGLKAAQKDVLLAGHDTRAPLMQVQKLIQGELTPEDVVAACEKGGAGAQGHKLTRFYGYLYIGLYYDAIDELDKAKKYLQLCIDQDVPSYMGDVGKIHLELLNTRTAKAKQP